MTAEGLVSAVHPFNKTLAERLALHALDYPIPARANRLDFMLGTLALTALTLLGGQGSDACLYASKAPPPQVWERGFRRCGVSASRHIVLVVLGAQATDVVRYLLQLLWCQQRGVAWHRASALPDDLQQLLVTELAHAVRIGQI